MVLIVGISSIAVGVWRFVMRVLRLIGCLGVVSVSGRGRVVDDLPERRIIEAAQDVADEVELLRVLVAGLRERVAELELLVRELGG